MLRAAAEDRLAHHIAAALAPCRDEGLLSRRAIADICRSDGGSLPAAMTSLFGFECRLGEAEAVADLLVRIGAGPGEWPVLEQYAASREGEVWQRLAPVLGERAAPGSPLASTLKNLWLEYDLVGPGVAASALSVFFGTDRLTGNAEAEWALELVSRLRGSVLPPALRRRVCGSIAALPEAMRMFQIGIMVSRPGAPLRVCIIGQRLDEICPLLSKLGWPGELSQVVATLQRFAPVIDHTALDLDVLDDGRLAPKLGIELYQKVDFGLGVALVDLTDRLRRDELCLPQKTAGLLAWSGITHERLYPELWPAGLVAGRVLQGHGVGSTFCRWLHHVKIVLEPDAAASAKVYLAVAHAFLADAAIRDVLRQATVEAGAPEMGS